MNWLNLHIKYNPNIGDRACAPALYFPLGETRDIRTPVDVDTPIIIGGGGLIHPSILEDLKLILDRHKAPVIAWGIGSNNHDNPVPQWPEFLRAFLHVGIRDAVNPYQWVPCASCMDSGFDNRIRPTTSVVAYLHHAESAPESLKNSGLPVLTNSAETMKEVLQFLGQAEFVITNTYHGVYWATLLGKRVICYPFSTRFHGMKHPPLLLDSKDDWRLHLDRAMSYPDSTAECRDANVKFFNQIR